MRTARIRPINRSAYVHVMCRVAGDVNWLPFDKVEKAYMLRLWKRLCTYYTAETVSFVAMGNHYHAIIYVPQNPPDLETAAKRYNTYYKDKRLPLNPNLEFDRQKLEEEATRMHDFSRLVSEFQQQFSSWYNQVQVKGRRGTLWADRFKSVILEGRTALWNCIRYVEMNPVRAGIVEDPGDYLFSSWGIWCSSGRHPFTGFFHKHLKRAWGNIGRNMHVKDLDAELRADMARCLAAERGLSSDEIREQEEKARRGPTVSTQVSRRVAYWSTGAIVGSKLFVSQVAQDYYGQSENLLRRLDRLLEADGTRPVAFRRAPAI